MHAIVALEPPQQTPFHGADAGRLKGEFLWAASHGEIDRVKQVCWHLDKTNGWGPAQRHATFLDAVWEAATGGHRAGVTCLTELWGNPNGFLELAHRAATTGHEGAWKAFLALGMSPQNRAGGLGTAAIHGRLAIVGLTIAHEKNQGDGLSTAFLSDAFMGAVRHGHVDVLDLLMAEPPALWTSLMDTALIKAGKSGQRASVERLLPHVDMGQVAEQILKTRTWKALDFLAPWMARGDIEHALAKAPPHEALLARAHVAERTLKRALPTAVPTPPRARL